MEHCKNPLNDQCHSENITLYIQINGELHPICKECWSQIADKDGAW